MGTYTKCCGKASCLQHSSGKSCHGHGVCTIYFLKKNVWFFLRLSMAINRISKTTEQNKAFRNRSPIDPSMMHRTGPKTLGICIQKPYDNPCAEKSTNSLQFCRAKSPVLDHRLEYEPSKRMHGNGQRWRTYALEKSCEYLSKPNR